MSIFSAHRCLPALFVAGLCGSTFGATSELRIASYNLEADIDGFTTPRTGLYSAIESMGATSTSVSAARPVDVLGLEETTSNATTVAPIVANLNSFYSPSAAVYAVPSLQGTESGGDPSSGNGPNSLIYNTTTLTLLSATAVGTATGSSNGIYRQILRYQFQPVGSTGTTNAFYVYVEHYKSGTDSSDGTARQKEAVALRADSAKLGASAHVIYTGDFNVDPVEAAASNETTFTTLEASGVGQAIDPLNNVGQGTKSSYTDSSTSLKFRDDFQLQTGPTMSDTTGVTYIAGSYTAYGNNGVSTKATLSTLTTASDHIPVFADYSFTAVPEPASLALLTVAGAFCLRRRRT